MGVPIATFKTWAECGEAFAGTSPDAGSTPAASTKNLWMASISINGSFGEGGGQILRTSLCLSLVTGKPFTITNIRARRDKPGLRPQHLTCVKAAQEISNAQVEGARIGSTKLRFFPEKIKAGSYKFDIGSAGSTTLVFQTLYLPLSLTGENSEITLSGGTHVPWSPCFHYLHHVFSPIVYLLGLSIKMELISWGFYPKGGGCMRALIEPVTEIRGIDLSFSFTPQGINALSASANLPAHVRERQLKRALERLETCGLRVEGNTVEAQSPGPGSLLFIWSHSSHSRAGFTALGKRGKPSEKVADEAVRLFLMFLKRRACIEEHLADQLLLPLSLAREESLLLTSCLSKHALTNMWAIRQFLNVEFKIEGEEGKMASIGILPLGQQG